MNSDSNNQSVLQETKDIKQHTLATLRRARRQSIKCKEVRAKCENNIVTLISEVYEKKPIWFCASVLSILYGILFIAVSMNIVETELLFGFCVWGTPKFPSKDLGCTGSPQNSHSAAAVIDAVMTGLAGIFYFLDNTPKKKTITYVATAFIIAAHGFLHYFLQQKTWEIVVNCYNRDLSQGIEGVGYILFTIFSFMLGLIILSFGFGFKPRNFVFSAIFAFIVYNTTKNTGGDLILPGLFVIVHPLSCITGLISDKPAFNKNVASWFVVCTLVGILELFACENILRPVGGHLWYDLTLHSAVLASLPYFSNPAAKKKKD